LFTDVSQIERADQFSTFLVDTFIAKTLQSMTAQASGKAPAQEADCFPGSIETAGA